VQGEELVDAGAQDGKYNAQHPHAHSIDRHGGSLILGTTALTVDLLVHYIHAMAESRSWFFNLFLLAFWEW
jgi:hypothetical protein